MRTSFTLLLFTTMLLAFSSCKLFDNKPPVVHLNGAADTTIIMREMYHDPGFFAEDNFSKTEALLLENDLETAIRTNDEGYTTTHEDCVISYSAADESGNTGTATRNVHIRNISFPYAGSYTVYRHASSTIDDTTYNTTIAADTRVAGRIRINKVCLHYDAGLGQTISYKLTADLWDTDLTSTPHYDNISYNSGIGFMSIKDTDPSVPWYRGMGYEEAAAARRFNYVQIFNNTYIDEDGTNTANINGMAVFGIPLSEIVYSGTEVQKIILRYNITDYSTDPATVNLITEEYIPID